MYELQLVCAVVACLHWKVSAIGINSVFVYTLRLLLGIIIRITFPDVIQLRLLHNPLLLLTLQVIKRTQINSLQ